MSDVISSFGTRTDEDAMKAIFVIEPESTPGTGFLFQVAGLPDNQHILTAYHVVEYTNQNKVKVRDVSNANPPTDYFARVQKVWKECDIALLRLDEPIPNTQPFTLVPQELSHDTKIRTFGFPAIFGEGWHSAEIAGGPLNGKYDIDFKVGYPDTLRGLSGGPVFLSEDSMYSVVGIISNHGPQNFQKGKFVPAKVFYNQLTEILAQEIQADVWCYVVLSEADKKKTPHTLEHAVQIAFNNFPQVKDGRKSIKQEYATDLVSSADKYREAIRKICQARIAIFDITRFEPAVMLLLGVRSVVRRGVTIVSTGDFSIGDAFDIPFNIKELTITSHAEKQYEETKKPSDIIRDKVEEGLTQLEKLPQYLDLPVFDAIRNLPPDYRAPDLIDILILCPYSKKYQDNNWVSFEKWLRPSLPKGARIMRILDLMSPRLVSSTIYEAIRRKDLCLVDWTEWRANVFFEFGVRLAVTGPQGFTICIIEDKYRLLIDEMKKPNPSDDQIRNWAKGDSKNLKKFKEWYMQIAKQCEYLLALFTPLEYKAHPTDSSETAVYENMMSYYYNNKEENSLAYGRTPGFTYETIEMNIDFREEPVSVPVHIDLLRTAELFGVERAKAQTVVLYPKNPDLNRSVEIGITQRLLAAWYYLRQEYMDEEEIVKDDKLFKAYQEVGLKLHDYIQDSRPALADEIEDILEALQSKKGSLDG